MSTPDANKTILDTHRDAANGIGIEEEPNESANSEKWVSTIHLIDDKTGHPEHFKFMKKFKPHPDVAAAWLFNDIGE